MGMLAGMGRAEAVLECDLDTQLDRATWTLNWLRPGERQTKKRRSIMRVAPVWRPWLENRAGKLVQYRAPKKVEAGHEPEWLTRDTASIKTSWPAVLAGAQVRYRAPNTLRHTIISEMHARGVPESQIEMAAGHRGDGTNKRNYRHLRPEYLRELIDGIESYFRDIGQHTQAHLRFQCDFKTDQAADEAAE